MNQKIADHAREIAGIFLLAHASNHLLDRWLDGKITTADLIASNTLIASVYASLGGVR